MVQCKVELKRSTPLVICADAIRECWGSQHRGDDGGPQDQALIDRVGNKNHHSSTLEHLVYTFRITDFSRAVLQELSRHRIASPSVRSTRYTLKELKLELPFNAALRNVEEEYIALNGYFGWYSHSAIERASHYLVWSGDPDVDSASLEALEKLRWLVAKGIPNDKTKYAMPEAYKVSETLTINARSLQNFFILRDSNAALWEIQEVAYAMYQALPDDHKYLFEHCLRAHPRVESIPPTE
jgi:thymidylate synthase (FAD)